MRDRGDFSWITDDKYKQLMSATFAGFEKYNAWGILKNQHFDAYTSNSTFEIIKHHCQTSGCVHDGCSWYICLAQMRSIAVQGWDAYIKNSIS